MENLPDSLYVDPRDDASSSRFIPQNITRFSGGESTFSTADPLYVDPRGAFVPQNITRFSGGESTFSTADPLYVDPRGAFVPQNITRFSGGESTFSTTDPLYVDPRGAYSSNFVPQNIARFSAGVQSSLSPTEHEEIKQLIRYLSQPETRAQAILRLRMMYKVHKERGITDLGLLLWNSKDATYSLLQELFMAYDLLSPPQLTMEEATRVCNALGLFQCIASHPFTRIELIKAYVPTYIYPFMNTTEQFLPFEYMRLSSIGVIGALVKEDDANMPQIVHHLLETETFPLCLNCMDYGGELTKAMACLVIGKMLEHPKMKNYCGVFAERFFALARALEKVVAEFNGKPHPVLLKNIFICYLRLSEISRCRDALKACYPQILRDHTYLNYICDDEHTRGFADQILNNLVERKVAGETSAGDLENQLARLQIS